MHLSLEKVKEKLVKSSEITLLFIMDCTGSMSSWIKEAKENAKKIS